MSSIILRSILTIAVGILLVVQREVFLPILVQCVGVAFLLPGIFALVAYAASRVKKNIKPVGLLQLLTGAGSMLFGLWLLLNPAFFVAIFMNLLGVILVLLGGYQIFSVLWARRNASLSVWLLVTPLLLVAVGVIVLLKPFGVASVPFLLLGIGAVMGGLSDLVNSLLIYRIKNAGKGDIVVVEEGNPAETFETDFLSN